MPTHAQRPHGRAAQSQQAQSSLQHVRGRSRGKEIVRGMKRDGDAHAGGTIPKPDESKVY